MWDTVECLLEIQVDNIKVNETDLSKKKKKSKNLHIIAAQVHIKGLDLSFT